MPVRIAYSCLVDRAPKLYWETLLWMDALIEIAGVPAGDLFVHAIKGVDEEMCTEITRRDCHLVPNIEPFDRRHLESNKLQQFFAKTFTGYDAVAFLDADMEVLKPYDEADLDAKTISGVTVKSPYQDIECWKRLLGREKFAIAPTSLTGERAYWNNLNGGLYLVPIGLLDEFGQRSHTIAREGLDGIRDWGTKERTENVDEVATALALDQMGLLAKLLPREKNAAPHFLQNGNPFCAIHATFKVWETVYTAQGLHLRPKQSEADVLLMPLDEITLRVNRHPLGAPYHHFRAMVIHGRLGESALALKEAELAAELPLRRREYLDIVRVLRHVGHADRAQALFARFGSEGKLF